MRIMKKPADPMAIRISAGGVPGLGNYLVYRGPLTEVRKILVEAINTIDGLKEEPEINMDEYMKEA